jgi:hypothetical protein
MLTPEHVRPWENTSASRRPSLGSVTWPVMPPTWLRRLPVRQSSLALAHVHTYQTVNTACHHHADGARAKETASSWPFEHFAARPGCYRSLFVFARPEHCHVAIRRAIQQCHPARMSPWTSGCRRRGLRHRMISTLRYFRCTATWSDE